MSSWKKLSERTEPVGYRTLIFKKFRTPDGAEYEFTTYGKRGAQDVNVIPLTRDNKVVIARQFRPGCERLMEEIPGGSVEVGEELQQAVARELMEETGYSAERLEHIGYVVRDAYSNVVSHTFIGYDCKKTGEQNLDIGEYVETLEIPLEKLFLNAQTGQMTDAGGVLLAYDKLRALQGGVDDKI
ncbi:MAG: NUDIX hydrolase [Candidatus Saccharimonadales bacterium]